MRALLKSAATALFSVGIVASASAQQASRANAVAATAPSLYMPFVWNGNALDQKILDAQAQMGWPHHHARHVMHHRHAHR